MTILIRTWTGSISQNDPFPPAGFLLLNCGPCFLFFTAAGLATATLLGSLVLILSAAAWGIALLYNIRFKEMGLFGNLTVAFCVAMTVIIGGVTVGVINGIVLTFAALAFLFDLGEEIAADAMDVTGDELRSSKSIAKRKNRTYALRLSGVIFIIFIILSFLPFLMGWLGYFYLLIVVPTASMHIVFFLPAYSEQYDRRRADSDSQAILDLGHVCYCIHIYQPYLTGSLL